MSKSLANKTKSLNEQTNNGLAMVAAVATVGDGNANNDKPKQTKSSKKNLAMQPNNEGHDGRSASPNVSNTKLDNKQMKSANNSENQQEVVNSEITLVLNKRKEECELKLKNAEEEIARLQREVTIYKTEIKKITAYMNQK